MTLFMPISPKNHVSHVVGLLTQWPGPSWLTRWSVRWFVKRYQLNMREAELPIEDYATIGALFTRRLKVDVRPLQPGIVHPVDAEMVQFGRIEDGTLIQSKGKSYSLSAFLKDADLAKRFAGGSYITYYLCPTDYHRVHAPMAGRLTNAYHIAGRLWPVNNWSVTHVRNLFSVNERVVIELTTIRGLMAEVMIGATNVGQIRLAFDHSLTTNNFSNQVWGKHYEPPIEIEKGQELGTFHMGSSVVLLFESSFGDITAGLRSGRKVYLGQTLRL